MCRKQEDEEIVGRERGCTDGAFLRLASLARCAQAAQVTLCGPGWVTR